MREYFFGLLSACLFCGLCGLLSPEGSLRRYIRMLGGFFVLFAVLSPFPSILGNMEDMEFPPALTDEDGERSNYDEIYNQALADAGGGQIAAYLERELLSRLDLSDSQLDVHVEWEEKNGEYGLCGVWVTLRDAGALRDPDTILSFVEHTCGCSCTIVYDF